MIIDAQYHMSVCSSFYDTADVAKILFADEDNRALLMEAAKAYSLNCDDLILVGRTDGMPERAYFNGKTLNIGYDDEGNATYFCKVGNEILVLRETDSGFALTKQNTPKF